MKRIYIVFLCIAVFLCGCNNAAQNTPITSAPEATQPSTAVQTIPTTVPETTVPETTEAQPDPLVLLRQWLEQDCSFSVSAKYTNLAISGFIQDITQIQAVDGGWYFRNEMNVWIHPNNYEYQEVGEFYYCYEGDLLVCYSQIADNPPQRQVLSLSDEQSLAVGRSQTVGALGLLPYYVQDFTVVQEGGHAICTYALPVDYVMSETSLLSSYLRNVFSLCGLQTIPAPNLYIFCTFIADAETLQPQTLTVDFSQLKPYVLSPGAQSGEGALDTSLVFVEYTFNYQLEDVIIVPEDMMP